MIRRLNLSIAGRWPAADDRGTVRLLAVSDERDSALEQPLNRQRLEPVDAVLGCGDLEPDYLAFLADAFNVPLLLVRGNHDRGAAWDAGERDIPPPLDGRTELVAGIAVSGLSWPGPARGRAERTESGAWRQALGIFLRAQLRGPRPRIMLSHVPPFGLGDVEADPYHTGFAAYRWLCRRLRPLLWLHGHTPAAAGPRWRTRLGQTVLVNVTGAVLIELRRDGANIGRQLPATVAGEDSEAEQT